MGVSKMGERKPAMKNTAASIIADTSGKTRVEIRRGEDPISWVGSTPQLIRVGAAALPITYIGPVETVTEYRGQGYARQALETSLTQQRQSSATLALLHGIDDFYPKFGFAQAGPEQYIQLTRLERSTALPEGWRARPFVLTDLPRLQQIYDHSSTQITGATVRAPDGAAWQQLAQTVDDTSDDSCRVVENAAGEIGGYAWRVEPCWYVRLCERYGPDDLVIGEAIAANPVAADALLATCRAWAREEAVERGRPIEKVTLPLPQIGPLADAALLQDATLLTNCFRDGSFMAQVLDLSRFLSAMVPEFERRLRQMSPKFVGDICFRTREDAVVLFVNAGSHIHVGRSKQAQEEVRITLPQTILARLALGGFPPEDLLSRLATPLSDQSYALCCCLFPRRRPHIFAVDRGID